MWGILNQHSGGMLAPIFFGVISQFIIWMAIIGVVIYAIRVWGHRQTRGNTNDEAMRILNQRYARGEITEEEYLRIKRTLNS
jgi:putative membrane protein